MDEQTLPQWQSLSTAEVEAFVERDPVVVLPLAAIEQHGPHLPLSTDLEIGLGILRSAVRQLPEDFPLRVLPPQSVGSSEEHLGFPGTLSLDGELLSAVICEIGRGLANAGVRRLVLSNSHGGNANAMDTAGLRLRQEEGLLVVKASYFRSAPPEDTEITQSEWRHGLHGGDVETSMMLHLRPDLVHPERFFQAHSLGEELEADLSRIGPESEASFSWLAKDLNPSGVFGDSRLADAEKGRFLVEHYAKLLSEVIQDARAFPLERLA